MASYIGLLKSRFDGSVVSPATAVDIEEAPVEDSRLPILISVGGLKVGPSNSTLAPCLKETVLAGPVSNPLSLKFWTKNLYTTI